MIEKNSKLVRVGNSSGVRVPKGFLDALGWDEGDILGIRYDAKHDQIVILKK